MYHPRPSTHVGGREGEKKKTGAQEGGAGRKEKTSEDGCTKLARSLR